jgi:hypothetical protein
LLLFKEYLAAGLSVIPITKGAKYPCVKWDIYQQRQATQSEIIGWILPLGIVCGKVSGGLIAIDFDNKGSEFNPWIDLVQYQDSDLALSLTIQVTPSGGFHAIYRCPDVVLGNEKLARLKKPIDGKDVLIETRGQGGQFLAYPSDGYKLIQKDFLTIPTISLESHKFLIACAKALDQRVAA